MKFVPYIGLLLAVIGVALTTDNAAHSLIVLGLMLVSGFLGFRAGRQFRNEENKP